MRGLARVAAAAGSLGPRLHCGGWVGQGVGLDCAGVRSLSTPPSPPAGSSSEPTTAAAAGPPEPLRARPRRVIYRARGMVPLRTLVRFKIFHLAAAAAAAGPAATALSGGGLPGTEAVLAAATVGACGGGAAALNWLARRYVGELSLLEGEPGGRTLVVSTLDGWGRRVDEAVAVDGLVPPLAGLPPDAAAAAATARPLLAVDVRGGGGGSGRASRQLLVSLTHNAFVDRDAVMRLLTGG